MESEDKDLLNWEGINLTDNSNKNYINNGIAFEHVVEELLKSQFANGYWVRTQDTNDGKKDFVHPDEINASEWLECKNYGKPLSINVISPTLILGAIHDINTFYIYSRSPLNSNALEYIYHYQKMKNIKIKVYDGVILDSCIYFFRNNKSLRKFFPKTNFEKVNKKINKLTTIFSYSIRDIKNDKMSNDLQFELGECFQLNIVAQNQSIKTTNYKFDIKISDSGKKINFTQNTITDETKFGDLTLYTIKCQTLHAGNTILKIQIFDKDNKVIKTFNRKIFVSDEPHCFMLPQWITRKNEVLSLIKNKTENLIILMGASGTGKSTILQQLCLDLLDEKKCLPIRYLPLQIDLKYQAVKIKEDLLNQIVGNERDDSYKNEIIDDDLFTLINGKFQSDDDFVEAFKKVAPNSKEIVFAIDNAYEIQYHHATLLNNLKNTLKENDIKAYFVFELNTNKMNYNKFFNIMNYSSLCPNIKCSQVSVKKFKRNDILNFFLFKYGIDIKKYVSYKSVEISALEVSRLAFALKHNGIIKKLCASNKYEIIDEIAFDKYLQEYLFTKDSLSNLLRNSDCLISGDYIFKFIYLNGHIVTTEEFPFDDIKLLLNLQIIKRNGDCYIFAHEKLRDEIAKNLNFTNDDYAKIYASKGSNAYAKCICAIERINNLSQAKECLQNFFSQPSKFAKTEELFNICKRIMSNIEVLYNANLGSEALGYVSNNYSILNSFLGREEFAKFLTHTAEIFLNSSWWYKDHDIALNIFYLLKKYLDRILSLHKNEDCILNADNCIKLISNNKICDLDEKEKNYYLFHFYNRKAIAMSRLKDKYLDNDHYAYIASQEFAKQAIKSEELEYQILVDDFHRHYSYYDNLSKKLITDYIKKLKKIEEKKINANYGGMQYHLALFEFLAIINYIKTENNIEKILLKINNILQTDITPYYTNKLNILKLYILLYLKDYSTAQKTFEIAIKFAYKHELRQFIYQLNFIYCYILKWSHSLATQNKTYIDFAFLALTQFLNINLEECDSGKAPVEIKRDGRAIKQLLEIVEQQGLKYGEKMTNAQKDFFKEIEEINLNTSQEKNTSLKIIINGVLFPNC